MKLHPSVTLERVEGAVERHNSSLDNPGPWWHTASGRYARYGFCVKCGADAEGVEPDARKYECESCGEPGVYGAEELLIDSRALKFISAARTEDHRDTGY